LKRNKQYIDAVIILLLTIFTFEQGQLLNGYTYFSDSINYNINHIPTNVAEGDIFNIVSSNDTSIIDSMRKKFTSEGCSPGYGYEVDDENPICRPLAQTKGETDNQTKSAIFCEALGCPYNPPSPYVR
jgi:hypothetical protein